MLAHVLGSFVDGALRAAFRVAGPSASPTCPTTTQVYARLVDFHPRCFALSPFLTADKRLEKPMTSVATLRTASISGLTVCCDGPPSGWLPGRFLSLALQLRHISMPVPINHYATSRIVHTECMFLRRSSQASSFAASSCRTPRLGHKPSTGSSTYKRFGFGTPGLTRSP